MALSAGCAAPAATGTAAATAAPIKPTPSASSPGVGISPTLSASSPGSTPPAGAAPIRAAFYYPWFPEGWDQSGMKPFTHYQPTLGYYSQDDPAVIRAHIRAMQYGHIQAGIASWWGQGHYTDKRVPALLKAGEELGFQWALYYENESTGDPSAESIRADLEFIREHYAGSPAYLQIDGRFVIFVYADAQDGCGMSARWKAANTAGAFVVLKVFPGYRACPDQPDAWHEYAPVTEKRQIGADSFIISPGYWKAGEDKPGLARDPARWNADIRAMLAAQVRFQLVTTFNEWGEGTAVESAAGWESPSGYGLYLDALHNDGVLPPSDLPETQTPPAGLKLTPTKEVPPPPN